MDYSIKYNQDIETKMHQNIIDVKEKPDYEI